MIEVKMKYAIKDIQLFDAVLSLPKTLSAL